MHVNDGEEMPMKHKLYMPPLEKFVKYGKFPWPLVISLLLALLTSLQVILVVSTSTNYSYSQIVLWNKVFLNRDVQGKDTSITNTYNIFNLTYLQSYMQETVNRYEYISNYTLDKYTHRNKHNGKPVVRMYINYLNPDKADDRGLQTKYYLTKNDIGPFSHYNPKYFIDIVESFMLEMSFRHNLDDDLPTSSNCYDWDIFQSFIYTMHGPITVSLDFDRGICGNGYCNVHTVNILSKYYWLNLLILILASSQLVLVTFKIIRRAMLVTKIQFRNTVTASAVWENLEFEEKIRFVDLWVIFTSIGNVSQILGALNILAIGNVTLEVNETVLGIGCFCSWIGIIQYLKPHHHSYIVIDTLSRAFSRLGPYICGILPVFIGFCFLAMSLFWRTGNYTTVANAMVVNFAMLNGDNLFPLMLSNISVNGLFGQLYCYAYLLFFISVVQNIFIAIITDGFSSLKENPIDKTGNEIEDSELYNNKSNISLHSIVPNKKDNEKVLSRQKSFLAFKKIIEKSHKVKDKTPKYLEKLESLYSSIEKSLTKLYLLREPAERNIDKVKIKSVVDNYIDKELQEIIDHYVKL